MTTTETHPLQREWGLLAAILVAIVMPPIGFVWAFCTVVRLRHHPRAQRPWVWTMAVAWIGCVLLVLML